MSNWITPAGSIGQYTQQQSMSFTFQASSTLGGQIIYELGSNTPLPVGLSIDRNTGVLSGSPAYVPVNTVTTFEVSATEVTSGGRFTNFRTFSITVSVLVWQTPSGNIGIFGEKTPLIYQFTAIPSQNTNTVIYTKLNGQFPSGLSEPLVLFDDGLLTGIPAETSRAETSTFTIRALEYQGETLIGFRDRTFSITVDLGITAPTFTTPQGALFTINDSTWTNYQLEYSDPDNNSIVDITVTLGSLPPGLEINSTGNIRGYATPPTDANGNPTTITYNFTLQIRSDSGLGLASYSITVVNQELTSGFIGRSPTLFNTRPATFVIPENDPFRAYYLTSNGLGEYTQDNQFIFKFIGYDFDQQNDLVYEVNGLESIGILNNSTTGWQSGTLPTIGANIETYNFTVRVFKSSNPILSSDTFLFSLTVIGDINTRIEWVTEPDLGVINNGAISDLSILAVSDQLVKLNYRIVGTEISSNLNTIVGTGERFLSFGDQGAYVTGSANGQEWQNQPSITESVTSIYFTDCVYDEFTENTVVVGYNQINNSVIGQLTSNNQFLNSAVISTDPIRSIIQVSGLFVAVGDAGTILTTNDPSIWPIFTTSGTTNNLNSICYGPRYVVVGDLGTILTSEDATMWTRQNSTTTINLRSVKCVGDRFVAVGDLGVILFSLDGITWVKSQNITDAINFKAVGSDPTGSRIVIVGDSGVILQSTDNALTWNTIVNTVSTTNLNGIYYDNIVTDSFYIVGTGGTILIYSNDPLESQQTLTSPTLIKLPPDLFLLPTGEISGRLAFESTDQVTDANVERTYTFSVQAYSTEFEQISATRVFKLTTRQEFYLPYDNIYIQAYTDLEDRSKLNDLLSNEEIFPIESIYRVDDPYFGKAKAVKYQHIFGVPSVATDDFYQQYIQAVQINHYWRNITLGELRTAVARNKSGEIIYEVVYSRISDNLVNQQGVSISKQIVWPRNIPLNLNNWYDTRTDVYTSNTWYDTDPIVKTVLVPPNGTVIQLNTIDDIELGMNVTVPHSQNITNAIDGTPPVVTNIDSNLNQVTVSVAQSSTLSHQLLFNDPVYTSLTPGTARVLYPNSLPNMRKQIYDSIGQVDLSTLLPAWMTSLQPDGTILGFTPAWVLCYCKPGTSITILANILKRWPYVLNQIDFEIDRFEVDRSKTYNYLGTNLQGVPLWNTLPSAQPNVIGNSQDKFVYFPRKTILPDKSQ